MHLDRDYLLWGPTISGECIRVSSADDVPPSLVRRNPKDVFDNIHCVFEVIVSSTRLAGTRGDEELRLRKTRAMTTSACRVT